MKLKKKDTTIKAEMNEPMLSDSLYKTGSENKEEEEIARRPESFGETPEGAVEPHSPAWVFTS